MTEKELDDAANVYLRLRKKVTETPSNKEKLERLVLKSDFERNMKSPLDDLWNKIKLHPLWAHVKVKLGSAKAEAIAKNTFVSDFEVFRGAIESTGHEWYVDRARGQNNRPHYTPLGAEAIAFCGRQGHYQAMPYRTKPEIPYRWARLAMLFCNARKAGDTNTRQFFERLGGDTAGNMRDPTSDGFWRLRDAFRDVGAFGPVTTLHALMDCGFSVVKPDVWLGRIAHDLGWLIDVDTNAFKAGKRDACTVAFKRLAAIAERASVIDGRKHTTRELDAVVSGAGMKGVELTDVAAV